LRFALPHGLVGDDNPRFAMLSSLLSQGHRFEGTKYSLMGPLVSAPLWLLGKAFGNAAEGVLYYDWLLFVGALVAFYFLLRRSWSAEAVRTFLLLLTAGSMFPRHLLHYGAEAFTAVVAGVGLTLVAHGRGGWGWPMTIMGAVNTPASLPALGLSSLRWVYEQKRLRYFLAPAAAAGLVLLDNWIRLGSPLHTGYETDAGYRTLMPYSGLPGLSYPLFFGLLSLTLSFGKGLAFFAPGLLLLLAWRMLALPDKVRATARLWLAFLLGLLLVYSKWWSWYGGLSAGPRFMLFAAFPATLLLAQLLAQRPERWTWALFALLLLALSCWGVVATTVFEDSGTRICTWNNYQLEHLCWFTPEFSVLWNPFVSPPGSQSTGALWVMGYEGLVFLTLAAPLLVNLAKEVVRGVRQLAALTPAFRF
jgi:hypothetical protein